MAIHYERSEKDEQVNRSVEGEDYYVPEAEKVKELPKPVFETSTECEHFYVDKGIQETGERVVTCQKCWSGMEVDPKHTVREGAIVWHTDVT